MEKHLEKESKVMWVLKSLLLSYVITGVLLLLLTIALYKLELNEKTVSAAIIGIYLTSTLAGGVVIGKMAKTRRFLWGMLLGTGYFASDYPWRLSYVERKRGKFIDGIHPVCGRRYGRRDDFVIKALRK